MDFIAKLNSEPNNNWIFLFSILLLAYISLIKYRYHHHFILIIKSVYSEKNANHFLREASGFFQKFNLMPVFIVSCALIFISNDQSINRFCKVVFYLTLFFTFKYLILRFLSHILEKTYLFEEIIFHSFVYEKVFGLFLFALFLIVFYNPFQINVEYGYIFRLFIFLLIYKWLRMIYLSFFKNSVNRIHIIIYLCTLEILPIMILTKYFS